MALDHGVLAFSVETESETKPCMQNLVLDSDLRYFFPGLAFLLLSPGLSTSSL